MAATQKDIANRLNLSRSLVAGVLNDRPGVWASAETRRRIHHTAREMDYRPNAAAQSLRTGRSGMVACVCRSPHQDTANILYSGVFEHLTKGLGILGYRLMVSVHSDNAALLKALSEIAATRSCDAVVLWDDEEQVEEQGELLERYGIPFAVKGRHEVRHPEWPQIDFDHEALMASAVRFHAANGHRRIAYIGSDSSRDYARHMLQGFRDTMQDMLKEAPDPDLQAALPLSDIRAVERQMRSWRELPEAKRPTALVTGGNNAAWWGVERALYAVGQRLGFGPQEFAMAGMAWGDRILHFGSGMKFLNVSQNYVAEQMALNLLSPLLSAKPLENPIVRLLPPLCPMEPMAMEDFYQIQPTVMEMWPPE